MSLNSKQNRIFKTACSLIKELERYATENQENGEKKIEVAFAEYQ